jgi:LytS/YehU family sensor histidine kinase
MRSVLENSEEDFIPLANEIELLEMYTKLEHFRFKDKFDYEISVDENIMMNDFVIPPMLLQPYVENAVWHGLRYKEDKGKLDIKFRKVSEDTVKIIIEDNGIGRKKSKAFKTENQKKQKSKGMGNIQKRISILNEMYKDKVDVLVEDIFENEEGTRVVLMLKKD